MRAMVVKSLAYLVSLFLLILVNRGAKGRQLTNEELDLDKQFKVLKKSSIKIIKTEYGDIYDCVDFYKQPAFDHPLLKNHTFHPEMKPSFSLRRKSTISQEKEVLFNMKSKSECCPTGSVPIKRVSKDDIVKMKQFTKDYASRAKSNGLHPTPGNHFAVLQTNSDPSSKTYNGATGIFSVYNFEIQPSQYSSAEVIIKNGDDTIQAGWTINPTINKDNRTRLFQYFSAGQSHCFNMLCPGFVNVNKEVPIDDVITTISIRGGTIYSVAIHIFKDPNDGNWWLALGEDKDRTLQGFWPRQLFSGLGTSATYVAFGGEVNGPPDQPLPPMGNGWYPTDEMLYSAYCRSITVLDSNNNPDYNPKQTEKYCDERQYGVYDHGTHETYGRVILFGGIK